MCLFFRLARARDFDRRIKYTQEPGLNTREKLFIEFQKVFWSETITKAKKNLLKSLYIGICERLFNIKEQLRVELHFLRKGMNQKTWRNIYQLALFIFFYWMF